MVYGLAPILGGVTLRRPSGISESPESLRVPVVLAAGALRAYDNGTRFEVELSWSRLTELEVDAIKVVCRSPFVSYTHVDGATRIVETTPPVVTPIAGTDPTRFGVTLSLRAQTPDR